MKGVKFTIRQVANFEHIIPGKTLLYCRKYKSIERCSGASITEEGHAILHRIGEPFKRVRGHNPKDIMVCYYEYTPVDHREYKPSFNERVEFMKTLSPERRYGLAYKLLYT